MRHAGRQPGGLERRQLANALGEIQRDATGRHVQQLRAPVAMPVAAVAGAVDLEADHRAAGEIGILDPFVGIARHLVLFAMFSVLTAAFCQAQAT
ncbi:Uncharacterised protein [Klebsiella pneumoniae]|nr:Uncharacterised protein [Klebsiella pneumoniae]